MDREELKAAFDHINTATRILAQGPVGYTLDNLMDIHDEFFKRCCPYVVGDLVALTKKPDTDNGWSTFKYLLVVGAKGKIVGRDYCNDRFHFDVEILTDSGFSVFSFPEEYLRRS